MNETENFLTSKKAGHRVVLRLHEIEEVLKATEAGLPDADVQGCSLHNIFRLNKP